MVGHDAEGARSPRIVAIPAAGQPGDGCKDAGKGVRIIHALHPLQRRHRAVKSHAGVHVLLPERFEHAVGHLVVLHEHVVPDFKVFAAFTAGLAVGPAGGTPGIIEDLRIGAAGAGLPGRSPPVVLLWQVDDVRWVHAHFHPAVVRHRIPWRIPVACKAGEVEPIRVDAEPALIREKLPRKRNGFLLKIIAERPVAEHFEERAVRRIAHLVDVACAQALLHVHQAHAFGVLFPHQIGDKRMHAGGRKQHGWIILRDEGRALDDRMALGTEKIQIELSKLLGGQCSHGCFNSLPIVCAHREWRSQYIIG